MERKREKKNGITKKEAKYVGFPKRLELRGRYDSERDGKMDKYSSNPYIAALPAVSADIFITVKKNVNFFHLRIRRR